MLENVAWISLGIAFACARIIAIDEFRHRLKMWILNIVWPLTALYFSASASLHCGDISEPDGK